MITTTVKHGISKDGRILDDAFMTFTYQATYAAWWRIFLFRVEAGFYYGYEGFFAGEDIGFWPVPNVNDTEDAKTGPFCDADAAVEDCLIRITAFCKRKIKNSCDGAVLATGLLEEIRRSRQEQARQLSLFEVSA